MILFLQHHPVLHAIRRAVGVESVFGALQVAAYLLEGGGILLVGPEMVLQQPGDFFQRHPLPFFAGKRLADDRQEHLAQTAYLLELLVVLHQPLLFFLGQPVALARIDLVTQLCKDLVVIEGRLEIDVAVNADADEAARAGGVGQRVLLVGGGDERGVAAVLLIGFAVGWAIFQFGR